MKCPDMRTRLIESLYGELCQEEETRVREHLAGCESCRQEMERLQRSRRQLAVLAQPDASLDFGRVYRTAAERAARGRRRWRLLAGAACAAAVLLLALVAGRLRLDWRPGQLVVSFGSKPPAALAVEPEETDRLLASLRRHEERLETLEEVARLLSSELGTSDYRQAAALAELRRQLARSQADIELLARQTNVRWHLAEQNIRDLYLTQFSPDSNQKGSLP